MVSVTDLWTPWTLLLAAGCACVYSIVGVVYRLWFSPLAKFPGPRLAAATFWYEFYYDVVRTGRYTWQIGKLHEQYGPIIRITPNQLHINDPDYYDEVFPGASRMTDKYGPSAAMFSSPQSIFGTVPHNLHRLRRRALNPFFSKASVNRLEPEIQAVIENLCRKFKDAEACKEPVDLRMSIVGLTLDVIMEYSFARSYDAIANPKYARETHEMTMSISKLSNTAKQCPWIFSVLGAMPQWLTTALVPSMAGLMKYQEAMNGQILAIRQGDNVDHEKASHPTIFHEVLEGSLPPHEKTNQRLYEDGQGIIGAGTLTTAHTLTFISFYVLSDPSILSRLQEELRAAMPDPAVPGSLRTLEQLPYLGAVISEGLRLSHPVSSRLHRVAPNDVLRFNEWEIPPGTPVCMTHLLLHMNRDIFPNPEKFDPGRWLKPTEGGTAKLEKYLVPFSRGTRGCIGLNLANAEMLMALAAIFRRFELQLYDTDESDIKVVHDFFNSSPKLDSKGLRVIVEKSYY